MKATDDPREGSSVLLGRREALGAAVTAAAGLWLAAGRPARAQALSATEVNVLNFALNLEYLEAEFYAFATTGAGLGSADIGGVGAAGPTTGGQQVAFSDARLRAVAQELAQDEINHVRFLRSALGAQAVAKPAINLAALPFGFASESEFLALSRIFEDVGVSAYAGSARLLATPDILEAAGRILATEAYHAGNIRLQAVIRGLGPVTVDAKDQIPAPTNYFPTDAQGRAVARTAAEVAAIVRGPNPAGGAFFPNGLNGAIR